MALFPTGPRPSFSPGSHDQYQRLACKLKVPHTPHLRHYNSLPAERIQSCGNDYREIQISGLILAAKLRKTERKREKDGGESLFKYLVSKCAYLQLQVY